MSYPTIRVTIYAMKKHQGAWRFIAMLDAYLNDREKDHAKRFQIICHIEWFLKNDNETLVEGLLRDELNRRSIGQHGRALTVEYVSEWFRVKIAREKLNYYLLGLLKTSRNGNLQTARLTTDKRALFFIKLQFDKFRRDPVMIDYIHDQVEKMEPNFFLRLGSALKSPAVEYKSPSGTKLQRFLLDYWLEGLKQNGSENNFGLWDFSDPAIAKLATLMNIQRSLSPATVRKTWERLGLRKARKLYIKDVGMGTRANPRIVLSQLRPRQ